MKNPKRFTEKLQWYKLNYRDPLMAQCSDKYEVRKYVRNCGLENILNELYGIYSTPDEVDFDKLPESFVLKDTLGCGGNAVILVQDKGRVNETNVRKQMWDWVNEPLNKKHPGREWVYDGRKHRIIAEKLIDSDEETGGLIDYKFFCFNGKVEYLYVIADRKLGAKAALGIFDANYIMQQVRGTEKEILSRDIKRPDNFEAMKCIAEKLAKPFPEARIDLYDVDNHILFGEITFFDASGYMIYEPDGFDFIIGEKFALPLRH
ncbi:MAG: carbonic anhydrase [Bacteroides fragilis]|nr:carbonic anhydrase [Bacteroides fragilis]